MSIAWHTHVCYKYSLGLRNSNLSYSNFIDRDRMRLRLWYITLIVDSIYHIFHKSSINVRGQCPEYRLQNNYVGNALKKYRNRFPHQWIFFCPTGIVFEFIYQTSKMRVNSLLAGGFFLSLIHSTYKYGIISSHPTSFA
jgi:hypothetical protein